MEDVPARATRNSVILYALITRPGGEAQDCRVRNLSATGACIDDTAALVPGERVAVEMGTLQRIVGEVVWVERRLAGLRFDRTIDLAAARKARGRKPFVPNAGWLDNLTDAHRARG